MNYVWIALIYLVQGFPRGFFDLMLPVAFRQHGVSAEQIGLMSLLTLPWSLKFLWSPAVDIFLKRKHWMVAGQIGIGVLLVHLSTLPLTPPVVPMFWMALGAMVFLSATQDIAIDAYSVELLEKHQVGIGNGIRASAYRVALILTGGVLVGLTGGLVLFGQRVAEPFGWPAVIRLAGVFMLCTAALCWLIPPTPRVRAVAPLREIWAKARSIGTRPGIFGILLFITIFKAGDAAMAPMAPVFLVDIGLTSQDIGILLGTYGVGAAIVGALLGGWITARVGIFHGLWALGLFQAFSNLGYAVAAWRGSVDLVWGAAVFEMFCGGLGTAAFLAYLMSLCDKQFAATQYAVLSALFMLGTTGARSYSGVAKGVMGYPVFFAYTFLLALPAFLLLPAVRRYERSRAA